jgi:hypothetical protein
MIFDSLLIITDRSARRNRRPPTVGLGFQAVRPVPQSEILVIFPDAASGL